MPERIVGRTVPYLRAWRIEKALNQVQVAEKSGLARSTIISAEGGEIVRFTSIQRLAEALGITVEQLLRVDPHAT